MAQDSGVDCILSAGDMFHYPKDWQTLDLMMDILNGTAIDWYTIWGQHDMVMRNRNEIGNLYLLKKNGLLNIPDPVSYLDRNVILHGMSWGDEAPPVFDDTKFNILMAHTDVGVNDLFPGQGLTTPQQFMRKHPGFDLYLFGDIHRPFIVGQDRATALNTGPLMRLVDEPFLETYYPCFYVIDTKGPEIAHFEIPYKPYEEVFTQALQMEKLLGKEISENLNKLITQISQVQFHTVQIHERILNFLETSDLNKETKEIVREIIAGVPHGK